VAGVETRRRLQKVSNVSNDNNPSTQGMASTGGSVADGEIEVTDHAKDAAAKMASAYDDRPTAVLPGSHNTVAGTAVNDWLDDDGNPKYGKDQKE
jgi:hypothetical protein